MQSEPTTMHTFTEYDGRYTVVMHGLKLVVPRLQALQRAAVAHAEHHDEAVATAHPVLCCGIVPNEKCEIAIKTKMSNTKDKKQCAELVPRGPQCNIVLHHDN